MMKKFSILLVFSYLITLSLTCIDIKNNTYTFILSAVLCIEFVAVFAVLLRDFYHGNIKSIWIIIAVSFFGFVYYDNFFPYQRYDKTDIKYPLIAVAFVCMIFAVIIANKLYRERKKKLKRDSIAGFLFDVFLYTVLFFLLVVPNIFIIDGFGSYKDFEVAECILEEKTEEYSGDEIKFLPATETFSLTYPGGKPDGFPDEATIKEKMNCEVGDKVSVSLRDGFMFNWYYIN